MGVGPDSGCFKQGGDSVEAGDWWNGLDSSCSCWSHGLESLTELVSIAWSSLYSSLDSGNKRTKG